MSAAPTIPLPQWPSTSYSQLDLAVDRERSVPCCKHCCAANAAATARSRPDARSPCARPEPADDRHRARRRRGARLCPYRRAADAGRARAQARRRHRHLDGRRDRRLLCGGSARRLRGSGPTASHAPPRARLSRRQPRRLRPDQRRAAGAAARGDRSASIKIEELGARFAAIATEIDTGHEVWLTRGRLVEALRASYALPGVFAPVRIGGRWLVDGALVNPVPVSAARALDARLVIGGQHQCRSVRPRRHHSTTTASTRGRSSRAVDRARGRRLARRIRPEKLLKRQLIGAGRGPACRP